MTFYSRVASLLYLIIIGSLTLTLLFTYYLIDRRTRGPISSMESVVVLANSPPRLATRPQILNISYHTKVLGAAGFTRERMVHPILDTFLTDSEKCSNCLPNYFIRASESDKPKYRRGTVGFLHHLKSGGTTIHSCLRKLLSMPYTWNGKTEKRLNPVFIEDFGFDKRMSWKKLNETSRLAYHFLGGTAVMGLCDDFQIDRTPPPCSHFTVLRDPIDRAVATYFYCKVKPSDMLCATHKLNASQSNITEWALHQRSFLFTQLILDRRFCARFSIKEQWSVPCWYRQRIAMEQANLETKLHFILEDMTDRFAVIGMLDHLEQSLSMFETVRVEKIN